MKTYKKLPIDPTPPFPPHLPVLQLPIPVGVFSGGLVNAWGEGGLVLNMRKKGDVGNVGGWNECMRGEGMGYLEWV